MEYKIEKEIAVISEYKKSKKVLTRMSWNGKPAKYDLRMWSEDGSPGKGITLSDDEMQRLIAAVKADSLYRGSVKV